MKSLRHRKRVFYEYPPCKVGHSKLISWGLLTSGRHILENTLFVSFIVLMLAGCSDPKIDATSEETMKASIEKVRASLSEEKRGEFDEAL